MIEIDVKLFISISNCIKKYLLNLSAFKCLAKIAEVLGKQILVQVLTIPSIL